MDSHAWTVTPVNYRGGDIIAGKSTRICHKSEGCLVLAFENGRKERDMTVAIVGGGLAGLTAAALLAKQGQSVSVFEQAGYLGGRAETQTTAGFHFNLGPHALYRGGWAARVLKELRIPIVEEK